MALEILVSLPTAFSVAPRPLFSFRQAQYVQVCPLKPEPFCKRLQSIRLQWVPGHSFPPGNDAADELASRGALLVPPEIP